MVVILMKLSEKEFDLLRKRDKEVLTRIYDFHEKSVATYFYMRTFGNKAVMDDLTQETFCAFIDYAPRIKSRKHVQFTLFSIAGNKLADYQRLIFKDKKKKKVLKESVEPQPDMIEIIHKRQKALLFTMALDSLSDRDRKVYEIHYVKEMEISQIASHFNKTYKSIDGILRRMREKLKKEMLRISRNFFKVGKPL
jgi:RNA polymerase sigma factor (sigma-70 family)